MLPTTRSLVFAVLALWTSAAFAGAWGESSFANDDAMDWVENELKEKGQGAVEQAIAVVAKSKGYMQVTECCYAVAACEVLAAAQGRASKDLPGDVAAIAKKLPSKQSEALRKQAVAVLEKLMVQGELHDLVKESGGHESWKKMMEELKARI